MTQVGELKTKVTFKQNGATTNAEFGGVDGGWTDYKTVRMKAMIGNSREFYAAQKVNSLVDGILQGRAKSCAGITRQMRAVCEYGTFEIIDIRPLDQDHAWMEIHVKEVV